MESVAAFKTFKPPSIASKGLHIQIWINSLQVLRLFTLAAMIMVDRGMTH
jgi:hypothetical protein